jgi:hypothetical protein
MTETHVDQFAGLFREFELGVRLAPTRTQAPVAARRLARLIETRPDVTVRLCTVEAAGTRVHLILAVCLGTLDDVKTGAPRACSAVAFVTEVVRDFARHDAALVALPISAVRFERAPTTALPESVAAEPLADLVAVG